MRPVCIDIAQNALPDDRLAHIHLVQQPGTEQIHTAKPTHHHPTTNTTLINLRIPEQQTTG